MIPDDEIAEIRARDRAPVRESAADRDRRRLLAERDELLPLVGALLDAARELRRDFTPFVSAFEAGRPGVDGELLAAKFDVAIAALTPLPPFGYCAVCGEAVEGVRIEDGAIVRSSTSPLIEYQMASYRANVPCGHQGWGIVPPEVGLAAMSPTERVAYLHERFPFLGASSGLTEP